MSTNPLASPAGTARMTFTRAGADTVLTRAFATSPSKLIATKSRAATCWVYTATLGGGFVGGDEIHLNVHVEREARALLTTQASTKVYRSLKPARQAIAGVVEEGGLLAVVPDPIVCFAGADFTQHQRYELHQSATLVVVDWMTSGRHAAGERWAFSRYGSRLEITRGDRPVVFDAVLLEHDLDSVAERMGQFDGLATAVITGPLVSHAADRIVAQTGNLPIAPRADLVVSTARLRDGGVLLRMAGVTVERLAGLLRDYLAFLSPLVGDDLWSRKW